MSYFLAAIGIVGGVTVAIIRLSDWLRDRRLKKSLDRR